MSILPNNNDDMPGYCYDGPSKAYMEQCEQEAKRLFENVTRPAIPPDLQRVLFELDFTGDFYTLGLSFSEAMKLDRPSLKRLINEKTGIVAQHNAAKEEETRENNKKFFSELNNVNRILF